MGLFKPAHEKTGGHEGGWSKNPNDRGGETIFGIARKFWPDWVGWSILDSTKEQIGINTKEERRELTRILKGNLDFMDMVDNFYRNNFFNKYHLDLIDSQPIVEVLYDILVNGGKPAGGRGSPGICRDGCGHRPTVYRKYLCQQHRRPAASGAAKRCDQHHGYGKWFGCGRRAGLGIPHPRGLFYLAGPDLFDYRCAVWRARLPHPATLSPARPLLLVGADRHLALRGRHDSNYLSGAAADAS